MASEDERLRQVVGLGHHVPCALVVDPLEPLVAVHQDLARARREGHGEREVVGVGARVARRSRSWRPALDLQSDRRGPELGDRRW